MSQTRPQNMIPKLIHFIWAGGPGILPEAGLRNVVAWAKANPGFTVKLWVDAITEHDVTEKYIDKFDQLYLAGIPDNVSIVDINESGYASAAVRYELDGLSPNYGAVSDLLRYKILAKEGGAYFDVLDVFPHESNSLEHIVFPVKDSDAGSLVFATPLKKPRLLLHITPHTSSASSYTPGTEAIVVTPNHRDMCALAEYADKSYYQVRGHDYKRMQFRYAEQSPLSSPRSPLRRLSIKRTLDNRFLAGSAVTTQHYYERMRGENTLNSTGPQLAIKLLKLSQEITNPDEVQSDYFMPFSSDQTRDWVSLPKAHAANWGKLRVIACDVDAALGKTLRAMEFESKNMHVFNRSLHVELMSLAVFKHRRKHDRGVSLEDVRSEITHLIDMSVLESTTFSREVCPRRPAIRQL